jgi:alpha-tubulin suppressor-like RCC1 family protein
MIGWEKKSSAAFLALAFILTLGSAALRANITVKGTVYYWNGDLQNADGTTGAYALARDLFLSIENDHTTVGNIDTWTDANGRYEVTFRQRSYRPNFDSLAVDIEVRAEVLLDKFKKTSHSIENTVSCYKGAVRLYPYNGQTSKVDMNDGSTWTVNIYVGRGENPEPPAAAGDNARNLKIDSWDYDDDGRKTVAGIFMCQACRETYIFLRDRAADKTELTRSTSIFYPEDETGYRDTASPVGIPYVVEGTGWIDVTNRRLFDDDKPIDKWLQWRTLRCTIMHEFSHKLMHDVYWTMPKTSPWMSSDHDMKSCDSGEMGWREGWADFLPGAILEMPTLEGQPARPAILGQEAEPNFEIVWCPNYPGEYDMNYPYENIPGQIDWRKNLPDNKRDWNEGEVAAVLWDIYDPPSWEYMPYTKQALQPPGWPEPLRWYERLSDPNLDRIWKIIKKEPEALNDEDEGQWRQDSFWTYWLSEFGGNTELVHGLKAILHNRNIRHALRPENDPKIVKVRVLRDSGRLSFAELTVQEPDPEDRPYLFFNLAYGQGVEPLRLMYPQDQPLQGTWSQDQLTATVILPPHQSWNRMIVLVHDSMEVDFAQTGDSLWEDGSQDNTCPNFQIIAAGQHRSAAWSVGGSVWSWGAAPRGSEQDSGMGISAAEWKLRASTPIITQGVDAVVAVACGGQHSLALRRDGSVWSWGNNYGGALGQGATENVLSGTKSDKAGQVLAVGYEGMAIACADNHSLVLRKDRTVMAWGDNSYGQLGDGTTLSQNSPIWIRALENIIAIAAGAVHCLAVDAGGNIWAWGRNDQGQVGDNTNVNRLVPVQLPSIGKVVKVAAGHDYSLALAADGSVWEWGQLGLSRSEIQRTPRRVPGLPDIVDIAAGRSHRLALCSDGTVWAWGDNSYGQLGDGSNTSRQTVARVSGLADVVAIAAGDVHSLAVRADQSVWAWGGNTENTLGLGRFENCLIPAQVQRYRRIVFPPSPLETSTAFSLEGFTLFNRY